MKIVVLDGFTLNPGDLTWDELKQFGELTVYDRTQKEDIVSRIKDAEIVFTNKTPIDEATLESCPSVRYIGVLATGYNVVDIEAAAKRNIPVTNIPTYGTTAVAQYVFALLLELCHHIGAHSEAVKKGEWENRKDFCFWDYPLIELSNKTMGIIGFGRIGQATAKIANAFGMQVLAYDEYQSKELLSEGIAYASLDEVLKNSDVISLHCPLTEKTKEIINQQTISQMKDGVLLINTSRGPLICEADLKQALESGKVKGAALDVVSVEPMKESNPLWGVENCIVTPHIAWAPKESRARLMKIAVDNLAQFLNGTTVNRVN